MLHSLNNDSSTADSHTRYSRHVCYEVLLECGKNNGTESDSVCMCTSSDRRQYCRGGCLVIG